MLPDMLYSMCVWIRTGKPDLLRFRRSQTDGVRRRVHMGEGGGQKVFQAIIAAVHVDMRRPATLVGWD